MEEVSIDISIGMEEAGEYLIGWLSVVNQTESEVILIEVAVEVEVVY